MCSLKCLMLRDLFLIEMYEWILLSHWFLFMYLSQAERIKWETLQEQHHMAKQKQKSGMLYVGAAVEQSVRCVCMCVLRSKNGEWFRNNRNGWRGNKMEIDNELNMFNKKRSGDWNVEGTRRVREDRQRETKISSHCVYEQILTGSDVCWQGAIPDNLCRITEGGRGLYNTVYFSFLNLSELLHH